MKKTICLLLSSLVLVMACSSSASLVFAAEGVGGAVQTNGHIGFYEGETEPSSSTSEEPPIKESSSSQVPSSSSVQDSSTAVTKPTGKYPSTGELVKTSLSISGIALLMIAFILFLFKRKKKEAEE
ncbi:LPXTG cell wall anchor domain-containing protein [Enterococcus larvae]